jgi:hypothetical protein
LSGNFTLSFGGHESTVIYCNDDAADVAIALQSIPALANVAVSRIDFALGVQFLVTFSSLAGDVDLLDLVSTLLAVLRQYILYEVEKGVGNVTGILELRSFDESDNSSVVVHSTSTADFVEQALESMASIGDVVVTKAVSTIQVADGIAYAESVTWIVTFTTFGDPELHGTIPNLRVTNMAPNDGSFEVSVSKVVAACCNVNCRTMMDMNTPSVRLA